MRNEEGVVDAFYARVREVLGDLPFELIIVDDGSTDSTTAALEKLAASDPRVRVVFLSRGFGHQAAITAGLDFARGDAVVVMDADLQDPPDLIPEMIALFRQGFDESNEARLSRGVDRKIRTTGRRAAASQHQDFAAAPLDHRRQNRAARIENSREIGSRDSAEAPHRHPEF